MNAERLLAHYHRVADAPDAVPKLRRFILDLAVRGKLVPQDPGDEPASALLKRIAAEKARLVKAGDIRKDKAFPDAAAPPFKIPDLWRWSRLAEIGILSPRNDADDSLKASFVPMAMISAEYGVDNDHEVRDWAQIKKGFTHFAEGDVGLAKITPCFENGKSTVFRNLTGGFGSGTTELHIVRPVFVDPGYVVLFLKTPHFIDSGIPKMTGTAGQKRVPTEYFTQSPFPLPPLAEQRRIVAKVDELMALCDRLEAARKEREARRDRLAAASLARLSLPDATKFETDVRFTLGALGNFTNHPEQLQELRHAILNLAVLGKLVEQNSTGDRPPRREPQVSDNNRLKMDMPRDWRWAQVREIASARLGKMLDKAKNTGKPHPYLGNTNVHWFDIRDKNLKEMMIADHEFDEYELNCGDILICEGGHGIGRTAVWKGRSGVVFQKALHRVRPGPHLNPDFFSYCCAVYFATGIMQEQFTGVGIPHFTGQALAKLVFPLPPLAEQHRIVAKVDELMALCDRLEASLAAAETGRSKLLEALLREALDPAAVAEAA